MNSFIQLSVFHALHGHVMLIGLSMLGSELKMEDAQLLSCFNVLHCRVILWVPEGTY